MGKFDRKFRKVVAQEGESGNTVKVAFMQAEAVQKTIKAQEHLDNAVKEKITHEIGAALAVGTLATIYSAFPDKGRLDTQELIRDTLALVPTTAGLVESITSLKKIRGVDRMKADKCGDRLRV